MERHSSAALPAPASAAADTASVRPPARAKSSDAAVIPVQIHVMVMSALLSPPPEPGPSKL
jgi:hypothetical protein